MKVGEVRVGVNTKKILKLVLEILSIVILLIIMYVLIKIDFKYTAIINSVCSCLVGVIIKMTINTIIDIYDSLPWQTYLRVLLRTKEITNKTYIRISYAYLFRIELDGKYMLIKNKNGLNKMQPPGHTYKLDDNEKRILKHKYNVLEDDKLKTKKIKDDYRLRVPAKHLRAFYKRFCKRVDLMKKENYLSGFKNTLIKSGYLDENVFNDVDLSFIKRDVQKISFSKFFQCYEMILADIIEVNLNDSQKKYLRKLMEEESKDYMFVTDKYINSLGVDPENNDFVAEVAEHSYKILQ